MVEHVPLYPLAPLLFLTSVVGFTLLMARHLRVWAYARPATSVRDEPGRLTSVFKYAIVQVRMFRDLDAGIMHATIFWGFVILTVGTADRVAFGLIRTIGVSILDGWLWRLLLLGQNLFVLGVLVMVGYALFRRLVWRYPRRTTLSRDGVIILLLIGGVVLSEWLAEAFRIAAFGDPDAGWAVMAFPLSIGLEKLLPQGVLEAGYGLFFWANVALVSFFLIYLPGSKHLHIVTAFFNAGLRKMRPRGELPMMDLEAADARFGVKTIEDLSWKDLLDGFTCTECGRCQEACPAWATGKPLNPKTMIMGIREMAVESEAGVPLIPWIKPSASPGVKDSAAAHALGQAGRRQRHPVRRRVGLPDLRRVRRGVPGDDRARRQDRRPASQPGARGIAVSGGAGDLVQQPRALLKHLGPAADVATRLGQEPALRRADGRAGGGGGWR